MLSKRIRLWTIWLFLIFGLLLGAFVISSFVALEKQTLTAEILYRFRWQAVGTFFLILFCFLALLHHWLRLVLKPVDLLPGYLKSIASEKSSTAKTSPLPGSDDLTNEAANLAQQMHRLILEKGQEKHKLELILANMDNQALLLDETGRILEGNKSFWSWLGLPPSKTAQEAQVFHNIQFSNFLQGLLHTKKAGEFILRLGKEGSPQVFQVFGAPLTAALAASPNRILLVFHDLSELHTVYQRQNEFVANASHELATPLTVIKGFAETLAAEDQMDHPTQKKFLDLMVKESSRMQVLLQDLLQLAKLDAADYRQHVIRETLPTAGLLEELQLEFSQALAARKLKLSLHYEAAPLIYTNKEWLQQILANLMENALKYTPLGGSLKLTLSTEKDLAVFTLFNSGEGLREEDLQKIFTRFYRADVSHNRKISGSGLGLAIVKFAVEMLGGTIRAENVPGQGVSFIFTIPVSRQENQA